MKLGVYRDRAERIRQYLSERDLEALVIFQGPNFKYVSNFVYDINPIERPVAAIIPLNGDPSLIACEVYINNFNFMKEKGQCWIKDIRFYLEHVRLSNRIETVVQWAELFSSVLKEKGILRGRVGVDKAVDKRIKEYLPEIAFVDASDLLREMRLIKCKEELDLLRKCGELTDVGQRKMLEELEIGRYECEIGTETQRIMAIEAAKRCPDYLIKVRAMLFGSGPYSVCPHSPVPGSSGRKIEQGDITIDGVFAKLNGYEAENERTIIVGEPTKMQKRIFNVMVEAQAKGIEAAVVGNKISDIEAATQKVYEKAGYGDYIFCRTGHGRGLVNHEYPYDMPFNHRRLKPGMFLSVEPGIYVPDVGGFRHSDNIIITEDGPPEVISKFPRDLESLVISRRV